jgi:hypothetical protein
MAAVLVLAALLRPVVAGSSGETLRARVSPNVAVAPAFVRVVVTVEPAADDRGVEVVMDSATYYRSSTIEFGGPSARVHTVEFRAVPEGAYEVRVSLAGANGHARATVHGRVLILGENGSGD